MQSFLHAFLYNVLTKKKANVLKFSKIHHSLKLSTMVKSSMTVAVPINGNWSGYQ